ncbi:MAG: BrnT family toxin [Bacillota bacterium]
MIFEYDPEKSKFNLAKHGIDFEQGQRLWDDPSYAIVKAKIIDESRYLAIGMVDGKYWSAVFTFRGKKIRIISIRRSRTEEVEIYES